MVLSNNTNQPVLQLQILILEFQFRLIGAAQVIYIIKSFGEPNFIVFGFFLIIWIGEPFNFEIVNRLYTSVQIVKNI